MVTPIPNAFFSPISAPICLAFSLSFFFLQLLNPPWIFQNDNKVKMDLKGFRKKISIRKKAASPGLEMRRPLHSYKLLKKLTSVCDMINQSRNGWNPDQRIVKELIKNNHASWLSQRLTFFLNRSQLDSIKWKFPALLPLSSLPSSPFPSSIVFYYFLRLHPWPSSSCCRYLVNHWIKDLTFSVLCMCASVCVCAPFLSVTLSNKLFFKKIMLNLLIIIMNSEQLHRSELDTH